MSFWIAGIKLGNWMKAETIDFMDVTFGLFWNCRTRKIVELNLLISIKKKLTITSILCVKMLHLAIHNNKKFNNYQNKQNQDIKKEIHKKEKNLL